MPSSQLSDTEVLQTLDGRRIILGVSGGIAAYKTPLLVRLLKKAGADVQVIMTRDAQRFVTPMTLATVSEREVLSGIFRDAHESAEGSWTRHIELGLWADIFVVAPATAQTIARLAHGFCDNMLSAIALSARCPLLICPAMDHDMYVHAATRANLDVLEARGCAVMPPEHGELASGLIGEGRLPEPEVIRDKIASVILRSARDRGDLAGRHVLVTAGPTREMIDPVRFVSNRSSGKMGYAIARAAVDRGARVTLVSGPTSLDPPAGVDAVHVVSAAEMHEAVAARSDADIVIMAAAVADYTPTEQSPQKIKKSGDSHGDEPRSLRLKRTVDILAKLGSTKRQGQILVGFALETENELEYGKRKLREKNLDLVVINNPARAGSAFGGDTNEVTLVDSSGDVHPMPLLSKAHVGGAILDNVARLLVGGKRQE